MSMEAAMLEIVPLGGNPTGDAVLLRVVRDPIRHQPWEGERGKRQREQYAVSISGFLVDPLMSYSNCTGIGYRGFGGYMLLHRERILIIRSLNSRSSVYLVSLVSFNAVNLCCYSLVQNKAG